MKNINLIQMPDGYLNRTPIVQFLLLSCLFPLWGAAASLNDILITQFKSVFSLSDFASALVQSAFYGGYFLVAIPASLVIKRTSYKQAIIIGLLFYIAGCSLFYPASHMATYTMFLFAIFAIAIGLGFLETAANTYSSMIGPREHATLRLNISQTFYPIGAISGILLGKYLVFQDGESLGAQIGKMTVEQAHIFRLEMLEHTLEPYKFIIFVLLAVLLLFSATKFPACKIQKNVNSSTESPSILQTLQYLAGNTRFRKGIMAQFLYVGMQVAVWSFTIRLALVLDHTINERDASNFMVYSFAAFFIGKFIANFLMTRFSPKKVLFIYSIIGSCLLAYVATASNMTAVYAAVAVSVLFGPCWATIYAETLAVVEGKYTEIAGAILVMSIVGGAVVPAIQGFVSDSLGSMQHAFLVSTLCFVYIGYYFYSEMKKHENMKRVETEKIEQRGAV
jgi:FHS family L-fucose permease-like MFS transporter